MKAPRIGLVIGLTLTLAGSTFAVSQEAPPAESSFVVPIMHGADPWVVRHEGKYYWAFSERSRGIRIHCSESLSQPGEGVVVWQAPETGPYSKQVWAPEIHFFDGRAYVYFAASDGSNANHRMFVLEATLDDPLGSYQLRAPLYTGDRMAAGIESRWAIDGTVLECVGEKYFIWSGWEDEKDVQFLYIARMANPWTVASNRVKLCANDDYLWERVGDRTDGRGLNEAPQVLEHEGRTFLIYSASASWLPTYKLGLLELAQGADPLEAKAWTKNPTPVFASTGETFGIGHGSFTRSPDGTEWWQAFHAKTSRKPGFDRVVFLQPFRWRSDGLPDFGQPLKAGTRVRRPAGELIPAIR